MLCVSDLEATVRDHPKSAALEHLLQVLEPDMELQISPPQASWASGLVVDELELMVWPTAMAANRGDIPMCAQLPPQQLFVGATSQAHEAQPQQLSVGASNDTHEGQPA